jgi:hypothetical protein
MSSDTEAKIFFLNFKKVKKLKKSHHTSQLLGKKTKTKLTPRRKENNQKPQERQKKTKKRKKQETEKGKRFRVFKELAKLCLDGWTETPKKGQKRMDDGKLSVSGDSHPHYQQPAFSSIH